MRSLFQLEEGHALANGRFYGSKEDQGCWERNPKQAPWRDYRYRHDFHGRNLVYSSALSWALSNTFYLLSLQGAPTPREMNHKLGYLGLCLVCSALTFSAQFWIAYTRYAHHARFRTISCASQMLSIVCWCIVDRGNGLEQHGAYNLLIFSLLVVPLNSLVAILLLWYRLAAGLGGNPRPRLFWMQLGIGILSSFAMIGGMAKWKEAGLRYGFCAARADQFSNSPYRLKSAVPWFDLLPFRVNFFTGPMTCAPDESFSALFEGDELVIRCPAAFTEVQSAVNQNLLGVFSGAAYSLLPRTESWPFALKNDSLYANHNVLQEHVLSYADAHTFPYELPIKVPPNVTSVLAWCGSSAAKIVTRFSRADSAEDIALPDADHAASTPLLEQMNVITIFLDAVSRPQFHRRLPLTRSALERATGSGSTSASLFEFFHYHTLGLNTAPNTRALWAGLRTSDDSVELDPAIQQHAGPPLWEQFQNAGYTSARVDPMCQDWSAYYNPGHFLDNEASANGTVIAHEHLAWSCFPPYMAPGPHFKGNFAGPTSIKPRCMFGTHVGWHELDWMEAFIRHYGNGNAVEDPHGGQLSRENEQPRRHRPFYLHATFMEGHEGSGEVLSTLDARLAAFLDPSTTPLDYNSTAVLIASDHGALMGLNYAFLKNGWIEAGNPFAALSLPDWYVDQLETRDGALVGMTRRERLERSQGVLVTGMDLYRTVRGLMGGGGRLLGEGEGEGFDLVTEDLSEGRGCRDVGVAEGDCRLEEV